jgi:Flp pilus assembly protein TadG
VQRRGLIDWLTASRFLRDERGAATIEFVLWVPVFVILLVATTDATILYLTHTEMWNVSRDIARRVAVGDMTSAQAVDVAQQELFLYGRHYTVGVSPDNQIDVVVEIKTNARDASVFGFFTAVIGRELTARVVMRREPV